MVAIAITLLALALPLPAASDSTTNRQLLDALNHNQEEYLAFLISFLVIGNHWMIHRRIFRYVNRLNGLVIRLNMVWLLMMIITPFATRILTGNGGFGVRFALYTMVQIIASVCLLLMSREIRGRDLMRPDAPESARHPDDMHSAVLIGVFVVSIPVAFAVGQWAFALWAAIPLLSRVLRRLQRGRWPATADAGGVPRVRHDGGHAGGVPPLPGAGRLVAADLTAGGVRGGSRLPGRPVRLGGHRRA